MTQSYVQIGTLQKPGPFGRIVRLALGIYLLSVVLGLLGAQPSRLINTLPANIGLWVGIFLALWVFPEVINIGWSLRRGNWPRIVILLLAVTTALFGYFQFDSIQSPPLSWLLYLWLIYTLGHLGVAFLLAAFIATPGCEMRSIPHLWTKLTGKETTEHFCPGMMDNIDKWERKKNSNEK